MRMPTSFSRENGFTLIEIITSIALLAMVVAVMLPIFPQIMTWSQQSEDQLTSSNLLGQVMNDVENIDLPNVPDCPGARTYGELGSFSTYQVDGRTYTVKLDVCRETDVSLNRAKIRIFAPDGKRHSEKYTYIKAGADDEASEE
ncbi:hypothetical protein JNUCC1_00636 [Lentibacillus sp. JNUCC-1]|uniref:type II secretion system protein n=1 Tax=Lentibacillus sp. JNUCC-1 TaxID=2654513 RepID=UPI00132AECC4|nr:prepilin-type N-terminal cleavage/methylation domain-containing protein [Lentibacillus sp. JNUCC-1]MUV36832.1 hypothetical protein [Lentibacillus sp. JNUCC-1]